MKELSIVIDVKDLKLGEEEAKMLPQELFSNIVNHVLLQYAQQFKGLIKSERKQVYEIDTTLSKAVTDKVEKIELEDNTFGFLRKCFREAKLTPNHLLKKVEENIDTVKDR
uniref:Uncharacterized protein n=1 Tax=viral metagenome TaxID=1070528 RepID=A0A6M3JRJ0_9ZZZZ